MQASELARQAELALEGDGSLQVTNIRSLENAGPEDLAFISEDKMAPQALASGALVILAPPGAALPGKTVLRSANPRLSIIALTHLLRPAKVPPPGVHPSAVVDPTAEVHPSASIGPLVVVGAQARVGARTVIMAGTVVGDGAVMGEDCWIHPNVSVLWGCTLGNRVILHSGVVIGSDGFGFHTHQGRHLKIPHLGIVEIQDDVEIQGNCSIDRAVYEKTIIGQGTKLDNLVHIAHNVQVGPHSMLAGQVGIAGSTRMGPYLAMGGQSGINGHIHFPDIPQVIIGGKSLLTRVPQPKEHYAGIPARPIKEWLHSSAMVSQLDKLTKKVNELWKSKKGTEGKE
ncbi:MAG: UDP-3-O-(3-hydroxymyristoyl)glucosamine N-acyltransferase [Deltaproteobacteria bacterium]|nr:UDP-3-O-(3-hydroxymyristoyl)glucosamine N-acyltransferase [Deltaproteobacteria bacterium]